MIEALLVYQQADAKLRKIETELAGSEARKKAISAKKYLEGVEDCVNRLDTRAETLAAEYEKASEELVKITEFQAEFESAVKEATDSSGVAYLIKKLDDVGLRIKALTGKLNKLAEEIQAIKKEYSGIKATTKDMKAQYSEFGKQYKELQASVKQEKEETEKQLEDLKSKVDPALMKRYLEKRAAKIYPVVYEARENVCGACNMELSMSETTRLKGGEIIECSNCGRLLYREKQ